MRIEVASSKDQKGERQRQRQQKVNTVSKVPVERVKRDSRREGEREGRMQAHWFVYAQEMGCNCLKINATQFLFSHLGNLL